MEFHETTKLFPEMPDTEFQELAQDIARSGLIEPIWTYNDQIIDGRHRYRVCVLLGITPIYRKWSGEGGSVTAFVVSKNLHRRHLKPSQRAALGVKVKKLIEDEVRAELIKKASAAGRKGGRPAKNGRQNHSRKGFGKNAETLSKPKPRKRDSRKEAAAAVGIGEHYVSDAERLSETSPELFDRVASGEMTLPEAMRQTQCPDPPPETEGMPVSEITLTLSLEPKAAASELAANFHGENLVKLVKHLAKLAGLKLVAS